MKRAAAAVLLAVPMLAAVPAPAIAAGDGVPVRGPFLLTSVYESTCHTQAGQLLGSFTATRPPANADGSYDVRVTLTATFVTLAGPSFNACNATTGANSGRIVREGVTGSFASTSVLHLTSATATGAAGCPRSATGACDLVTYLHAAYGAGVVITQTSVHAVLRSSAPRLTRRQAVETCSGAACAAGQLTITGDIASGHT